MRERRLTRTVRAHQRVHFTRLHFEIHTVQDLVAGHTDMQVLDLEHAHGMTTFTSSPSTTTSYTGTGVVAGRVCGSPVSRENVEPCFGHSISRSSAHTSPSDSEKSACEHVSLMA